MREDRRRRGPVANDLSGSLRGLPDHLCAEVLFGVGEHKLFSDGDTVVANLRRPPATPDENRLRLRPQRDPDGVGQCCRPAQDFVPGLGAELTMLAVHETERLQVPRRLHRSGTRAEQPVGQVLEADFRREEDFADEMASMRPRAGGASATRNHSSPR